MTLANSGSGSGEEVVVEYAAVAKIGEIVKALGAYLAAYAVFIVPASYYLTLAIVRLLEGAGIYDILGMLTPALVGLLLFADLIAIAAAILMLDATSHEPPSVRLPEYGYLASQLYAVAFASGLIGLLLLVSNTLDPSRLKALIGGALFLGDIGVAVGATYLMSVFISRLEDMVGGVIETVSLGRLFLLQLIPVLGVVLLGLSVLGLYIEYQRLNQAFIAAGSR